MTLRIRRAVGRRPVSFAAMDLTWRTAVVGERHVVSLVGELDLASVPNVQTVLARAIGDAPGHTVVVDLDALTVLDDTGMGILLGAAARARQHGGDLVLVCSSPRLRERFELSGLARAIEVRDRLSP
jgi:anti-anti-sigma factor